MTEVTSDKLDPQLYAHMKKITQDHLGVNLEDIKIDSSFDDMKADSLDQIELTMAFEEEFGIEITDAQAETIKTFGEAVAMVQSILARGAN